MVVGAQAREIDTVVIGSGPGGYVAAATKKPNQTHHLVWQPVGQP